VELEPRVRGQPPPHGRMLMRTVIIEDEVKVQPAREGAVQLAQGFQELLMPVPAVAFTDDGAVQHAHGSEQRRRATNDQGPPPPASAFTRRYKNSCPS